MSQPIERTETQRIEAAKKWAMIGYALQAASFVVGISYIAAVIVAYLKLPQARGTWVESHYLWQIRTFWYSFVDPLYSRHDLYKEVRDDDLVGDRQRPVPQRLRPREQLLRRARPPQETEVRKTMQLRVKSGTRFIFFLAETGCGRGVRGQSQRERK